MLVGEPGGMSDLSSPPPLSVPCPRADPGSEVGGEPVDPGGGGAGEAPGGAKGAE